MVNASRIIRPSIGGIVIATVGEGWCFMADAISYLAVIGSLLAMHVNKRSLPARPTRIVDEMRTRFVYVAELAPVRSCLLLLALVSMMGMPYTVLMPVIAATLLHGGPHTLGFLMTASGAGALGGAFYLASRRSVLGLGRAIAISAALFGGAFVAFSFSWSLVASLLILPFVGGGMMVTMAASARRTRFSRAGCVVSRPPRGSRFGFPNFAHWCVRSISSGGSSLRRTLGRRPSPCRAIVVPAQGAEKRSITSNIRDHCITTA